MITALSVWPLLTGAAWIESELPGGLPAGNALAALSLCALAAVPVAMSVPGTALRRASLAVLIAAAAWLPISIALAGNLALNFAGDRGGIWLMVTLAVIVGVAGTLLWASIAAAAAIYRRWMSK
ncbi:hypothetical protein HIV01_013740 [Lysobacter arenosi]|uniref:Transmembrane protein n=1 Tax=Lysobacter arenosi TaxID=2795387 RepID=A0ABX7RB96_9GAMM|nr:hypothetical protein [Lysobacter arenosi]QSX74246.1 hypothetical protein HIV01_013740 [Lysobacter arenosi]